MAGIVFPKFAQVKQMLEQAGGEPVTFAIRTNATTWNGTVTVEPSRSDPDKLRLWVVCLGEERLGAEGYVRLNNTELVFNRQVAFLWGQAVARVEVNKLYDPADTQGGRRLVVGAEVVTTGSRRVFAPLRVTKLVGGRAWGNTPDGSAFTFPVDAATFNEDTQEWQVSGLDVVQL